MGVLRCYRIDTSSLVELRFRLYGITGNHMENGLDKGFLAGLHEGLMEGFIGNAILPYSLHPK